MTKVFADEAEALRRLHDLGVPPEALKAALLAGHAARLSATENDAPFIPGTYAWAAALRTLRDELCPRGWRKADPSNFSLVANDARKISIVVESGDSATGLSHIHPRTKSLKGLYMEAVTVRNNIQGDLFPDSLSEELHRATTIIEYPTYVFLISVTDDLAIGEFSLPEQTRDNKIVKWKERILIPVPEDHLSSIDRRPSVDTSIVEIDIPVLKKT